MTNKLSPESLSESSSADGDADHYVIIRNLLDFIPNIHTIGIKVATPEISFYTHARTHTGSVFVFS
jgi:hypothetical protein